MKKYHITITDNETGETLRDHDTDAILAAISKGDYIGQAILTECDSNTLMNALNVLEEITKYLYEKDPILFFLLKRHQKKKSKAEEATDETTEN